MFPLNKFLFRALAVKFTRPEAGNIFSMTVDISKKNSDLANKKFGRRIASVSP
jgi:hypothetical protein